MDPANPAAQGVLSVAQWRAASFHVCLQALWAGGGYNSDVIAAVEAAVVDGVDVLSASLGDDTAWDTMSDPVSVAYMNAGGFTSGGTLLAGV
jgi:hypothetical protein